MRRTSEPSKGSSVGAEKTNLPSVNLTQAVNDATLNFDPRTASEDEGGGVKHQPQWLHAALLNKNANMQFQLGAFFPYARYVETKSQEILDHMAEAWIACKPVVRTLAGAERYMPTRKQLLGELGEDKVTRDCTCPRCKRQPSMVQLPPDFKCADVICDFCGFLGRVKAASVRDIVRRRDTQVPSSRGWATALGLRCSLMIGPTLRRVVA